MTSLSTFHSLLCVTFKLLERLIYTRVEAIINFLLSQKQTCFQRRRSTVDQVTLLTQDIKKSFVAKKKIRVVFVDLRAAYDTIWHRGLTCKLLRLLPDRHMANMIITLSKNSQVNQQAIAYRPALCLLKLVKTI